MEVKQKKVLIADDEPDILEIISYNLGREGYDVYTARDGNEAIERAKILHPDLIILDIMMPRKTGIEVCQILRSQPAFQDTLIIFLTALSDEGSEIKGLETGADDYVSKPISPKVLVSRVNALFRRLNGKETGKLIEIGGITIDPVKFLVAINGVDMVLAKKEFELLYLLVAINGVDMVLAKKEFELLYLLASRPGRVFLRNEILSQVWGNDVIVGDRTIDVHIRKVRQKLGVDCITTVKGVGYKFEA